MRKIILLTFLISSFLKAQFYEFTFETQVQTHYTEKGLKFFEDWSESPKEREQMIEMNRNPPKEQFRVIYNERFSQSEYLQKLINKQNHDVMSIVKLPYNVGRGITNNYQENVYSFEMDVYGKKYLVKDQLLKLDFIDTNRTKQILDFNVFEAKATIDEIEVVIWYTKEIPYHYTPDIYFTDKGFVLELHYKKSDDESEMINSWIAINKKVLKKTPKISPPTKGIVITADKVDAVWDEANEKMNTLYIEDNSVDKK